MNANVLAKIMFMNKENKLNLGGVSGSDLDNADMWYCLHKNHVNKLFNSAKNEYPPTELEDIKNPNLWKAEHWRWFLNNYR
jgi:hypothetical protein